MSTGAVIRWYYTSKHTLAQKAKCTSGVCDACQRSLAPVNQCDTKAPRSTPPLDAQCEEGALPVTHRTCQPLTWESLFTGEEVSTSHNEASETFTRPTTLRVHCLELAQEPAEQKEAYGSEGMQSAAPRRQRAQPMANRAAVDELRGLLVSNTTARTKTGVLKRLPSSAEARLRSLLQEGDIITYRSSAFKAVFKAAPARFHCRSECCKDSDAATDMTLNQLERHWGRGKARKAWQNMLLVSRAPGTGKLPSLWDLDRKKHGATKGEKVLAHMLVPGRAPEQALAHTPVAVPPSESGDWRKVRVRFQARDPTNVGRKDSQALKIPRWICSMPGCRACICRDCRGRREAGSFRRHFWLCSACRQAHGLPLHTRETQGAVGGVTRSRRVTYAPARFEDWIEQHEAVTGMRRRSAEAHRPTAKPPKDVAPSEINRANPLSTETRWPGDQVPHIPAQAKPHNSVAEEKARPSDVNPADAGQEDTHPEEGAAALTKASSDQSTPRGDGKKQRKRRRKELPAHLHGGDAVLPKWTSKGPGQLTWLPTIDTIERSPKSQRIGLLPMDLLLNPFAGESPSVDPEDSPAVLPMRHLQERRTASKPTERALPTSNAGREQARNVRTITFSLAGYTKARASVSNTARGRKEDTQRVVWDVVESVQDCHASRRTSWQGHTHHRAFARMPMVRTKEGPQLLTPSNAWRWADYGGGEAMTAFIRLDIQGGAAKALHATSQDTVTV